MKDNVLPQIRQKLGHDCWIQMDVAPTHWARSVREWIDEEFPDRWIGRDGPVPLPPRSPDLTQPDFFFFGDI
jgi:hypothetical protein